MISTSRRSVEKRKKREKRVAAKLQRGRRSRHRIATFPTFRFVEREPDAPEEFVKAVRKACMSLDLRDSNLFSSRATEFLATMKRHGYAAAALQLARTSTGNETELAVPGFVVGNVIFEQLRLAGVLGKYVPYSDVEIRPVGRHFQVSFSSLRSVSTPWGIRYYSRREPAITFDGKQYVVAFSRHAVERTCERTVADFLSYGGAGDAHAFLASSRGHEPRTVRYRGCVQPAFSFWDICTPGFACYALVDGVLGRAERGKEYFYRVGYCPVGLWSNIAGAITLLTPGMKGTPEWELINRTRMPGQERQRIRDSVARSSTWRTFCENGMNCDAVRWFHEHGIPQVIASERKFYIYE